MERHEIVSRLASGRQELVEGQGGLTQSQACLLVDVCTWLDLPAEDLLAVVGNDGLDAVFGRKPMIVKRGPMMVDMALVGSMGVVNAV